MKIKLKTLVIENFKGIRSKTINFNGEDTNVYGANGKCKSTVFDAFCWLLIGKNSFGKSDFEIKTLDEHNNPIEKIDHVVSGDFDVDGLEIKLSRTLREKWVKPKGKLDVEFQGNETIYTWNEVPVSAKEFKEKIEANICSEEVFKTITNPLAFDDINWKERRKILFDMAGEMSDIEILNDMDSVDNKNQVSDLINILNRGVSFEEYKREVAGKKKRLNDELKAIPTRIDEINRSMPDPVNGESINKMIEACNKEIDEIDHEIADSSKANESNLKKKEDIQNQIYALRNKISELEQEDLNSYELKVREIDNEISSTKNEISNHESLLSSNKTKQGSICDEIIALTEFLKVLREEYIQLNSSEIKFNEDEFSCPSCSRPFESDDIEVKKEELTINFNNNKVKKIEELDLKGKERVQEKNKLQEEVDKIIIDNKKYEDDIKVLNQNLDDLNNRRSQFKKEDNTKIVEFKRQIEELTEQLNLERQSSVVSNSNELMEKKRTLNERISSLMIELQANNQIEKANNRIHELEAKSKSLGQEVASMERYEYLIDDFTKRKIEAIEDNINSKFGLVKFKMYNRLINGGDEETCVAMVDGVPFSNLNTAMQINAGIDIINALSRFYKVEAPIFIDRAESVNILRHTNSQLIRLVVTMDQSLVIETVSKL